MEESKKRSDYKLIEQTTQNTELSMDQDFMEPAFNTDEDIMS